MYYKRPMTEPQSAINAFCDVLLPGDEAWPSASAAAISVDDVLEALGTADRLWLEEAAIWIASQPAAVRQSAMGTLEQTAPAPFGRVLSTVYGAYYAAPAVHGIVQRMSAQGPKEASPFFDRTWLHQVIGRARPPP